MKVVPAYKHDFKSKPPDTAAIFSGSVPGTNTSAQLPDGSTLVEINGWQMAALKQKDDTLTNARGTKPEDVPLFTVGAAASHPQASTTTAWARIREAIWIIGSGLSPVRRTISSCRSSSNKTNRSSRTASVQ